MTETGLPTEVGPMSMGDSTGESVGGGLEVTLEGVTTGGGLEVGLEECGESTGEPSGASYVGEV